MFLYSSYYILLICIRVEVFDPYVGEEFVPYPPLISVEFDGSDHVFFPFGMSPGAPEGKDPITNRETDRVQ